MINKQKLKFISNSIECRAFSRLRLISNGVNKNFNGKKYLVVGAILATGFFFLPVGVKAATSIYFDLEQPTVYEGDIFLADLKISTPDKPINVIDGTILYDGDKLEILEISTGGSLLALWPKPPVFTNSNNKGTLSFVGGVTGGFQGKNGEVLKIIFLAKSEGEGKIDFLDGFSVFLHDGQGSQINPGLKPLSLNILKRPSEIPAKDEWQNLVEKDKTPPEAFEIVIGQDLSIFDNQYFISFFTTDAESGIAYYEVKEGERDFVRSESPYLLQDQSLKTLIKVKAIDNAGNERIIELMPSISPAPFNKTIAFWAIILGILAVIFVILRLIKSKTKPRHFDGGTVDEADETSSTTDVQDK